jgi:hypothetical protein
MDPYGSSNHDPLAITTYRVCYEVEDGAHREWEFATEKLAQVAKALLLVRYPTARILASTSFYSSGTPEERERYESRLQSLTHARHQEEQLLLSAQPI